MNTYVMLTRLLPGILNSPAADQDLNRDVDERIKRECSGVRQLGNYAVFGPGDYVDIFEASDADTATKVALLIRSFGRVTAVLWPATPWDRFVDMAKRLWS